MHEMGITNLCNSKTQWKDTKQLKFLIKSRSGFFVLGGGEFARQAGVGAKEKNSKMRATTDTQVRMGGQDQA